MAGRGPAPKAQKRRTNTSETVLLTIEASCQPDLPDSFPWPQRTLEWWHMWRDSPQAKHFVASDWDFLLDTALVHADVWGNFNLDRLGELRIRVAKFGATPEDRARLKMDFVTGVEPEEAGSVSSLDAWRSRIDGTG